MSSLLDLPGLPNVKKRENMIHWHFKNKSPASGSHTQKQAGQAPTEAAQQSRNRHGFGRTVACGGLLPAVP